MEMEQSIRDFPKQFEYNPVIENEANLKRQDKFVVVGMGGSHLAADLLKAANPLLDIIIQKDYGLPDISDEELKNRLIIASSYSGNTEETIDALENALSKGLNAAVVSKGGKLIKIAQENNIPYIKMPDTGIQPRLAVGFSFKAIEALIEGKKAVDEYGKSGFFLDSGACEQRGRDLSANLRGKIPIIYSSRRNAAIAYVWKIIFNETGKIPSFYNEFPELNHNEMAGFEAFAQTKNLSEKFHFIFLKDENDDTRIIKRMEICEKFLKDWGLEVEVLKLRSLEKSKKEEMFNSILVSYWAAFYIAKNYGIDSPGGEELVEKFKKQLG